METHLTSLANTVAQISLELRSIKSIEDVIYNLRKEVHELKNINLGRSNSQYDRVSDLHRSTSEPNIINSILNTNNGSYNMNSLKTFEQRHQDSVNKRREFMSEKERLKSWAPSYTNPKKLKKLTKQVYY